MPRRTTEEVHEYIKTYFLPNAKDAEIDKLLTLYPEDPAQGSPFDTGEDNAVTLQFKRIAALLGDIVFQAPRRFFLEQRSDVQNTWFYCASLLLSVFDPSLQLLDTGIVSKRLKSLPIVGSAHGTDMSNIYGPKELTDYLIHFATNLDPNGGSSAQWPQYTRASPQVMTLTDPSGTMNITQDTYRADAIAYVTELSLAYPIKEAHHGWHFGGGLGAPFSFLSSIWSW
jgi:acetylcholinesterase